MLKLFDKFIDWCQSLEPEWLGYTLYMTTSLFVIIPVFIGFIYLLVFMYDHLSGWSVLVVFGLAYLGLWVKALFFQS